MEVSVIATMLLLLLVDDPQDFMLFTTTLDFRHEIKSGLWPPNWYDTPFILQHEWVYSRYCDWEINRYEDRKNKPVASSLETWTEFTPYLKANFPTVIQTITCSYSFLDR